MKRKDDPFEHGLRPDKGHVERLKAAMRHHVPYEEEKMRRKNSKLSKGLRGEQKRERRVAAADLESAAPDTSLQDGESRSGMVISISRRSCRIYADGEALTALLPKSLAREQQTLLAVGDRVGFAPRADQFVVTEVLPRTSLLSRPDPHDPDVERAIAANIDQVIHVVSVKSPPLHPRIIDRYMIAAERGETSYVLCVNKIDLLGEEERELPELDVYRALGVRILFCSTKSREGLDELHAALDHKTSALVGHSGVGKSSLLNALDPDLKIATKEVSEAWGTGRHTTSSSTVYRFGEETWVIDTPGIRELGLWDLSPRNLVWYFPEFEQFSLDCHFRNCTHTHEPSCAVKDAVEEGDVLEARFETYLRLYEELEENEQK
jgi:ribosome biogenesis GTPase